MKKFLCTVTIIICLFSMSYPSTTASATIAGLTAELSSANLEQAQAIRSTAVAMKQRGEKRIEASKLIQLTDQKIAALTATLDQLALAKAEAKGKTAQIAAAAADAAAYLQKEANAHGVKNYTPAIDITYSMPSDADVYNDAIRQALIAQAKSPFPNKEGVVAFINEATHKLYVDINTLYNKTIPTSTSSSTVDLLSLKKTTDKLQRATKKIADLVKKNKKRKNQRLTAVAAKKAADDARAAAEGEKMRSKAIADKANADAAVARKEAQKAAKIRKQTITAAKNRVAKEKAKQDSLDAIVKRTLREQQDAEGRFQDAEGRFKEKKAKLKAIISDEKNKMQQAEAAVTAALAAQKAAERRAQQATARETAAIAAATQAGQTADQEKINRAAAETAKQEANQARTVAEQKTQEAEAAQQRADAAKQAAERALAALTEQHTALETAHQQALITKENEVAKQKKKAQTRKQELVQEKQRNSTLARSLKTLQPELQAAQRSVNTLSSERDAALAQVATAQEAARLATEALTASEMTLQQTKLALSEKTQTLATAQAALAEAQQKVHAAEQTAARETARAAAIEQQLGQAKRTISEKDDALAKALEEANSMTSELHSRTISPVGSDAQTSPRPSSPLSIDGAGVSGRDTPEIPGEPRVFGMTQKDILFALLYETVALGKQFKGSLSEKNKNVIDIGTNHGIKKTSNLTANMPLIRDIVFRLATTTDLNLRTDTPTIQRSLDLTEEQLREQYSGSKQLRAGGTPTEKKNAVTLQELAGMLFMNLKEAKENTARPTREPMLNEIGIELSLLRK